MEVFGGIIDLANDTLLRCYAVTPKRQDANKRLLSKIKRFLLMTGGSYF